MKRVSLFFVVAVILFVAAVSVRTYRIDTVPAGLYPDEAVNGTDALRALEEDRFRLFYENNNGREGLFINVQALSIGLFGNTVFALKLPSIILGALTALFTGLLARELFANRAVGLIAMSLTAFSYWAINFSRIGFRANAVPFFLASAFFFLLVGLRKKNSWFVAGAGALFGLGLHTYIAYRIAPIPLLALFFLFFLAEKNFFKERLRHIGLFLACAFVACAPLLWDFFVSHPEHFASRSSSISVFSPEVNHGQLFETVSTTFAKSISKYFLWGDMNWRHNLPPYPILDPLSAFAFLLGLGVAIWKTLSGIRRKIHSGKYPHDLIAFPFLLVWFLALLAPEFLTSEGNPHALRSIGTIPPVYILAAYPLMIMWRRQKKSGRVAIGTTVLVALLFYSSAWNIRHYFVSWASSPQSRSAFDERYTRISHFINSQPGDETIFVVANGHGQMMDDGLPVSAHVVKYLTHGHWDPSFVLPSELPDSFPAGSMVVLMDRNPWLADEILRKSPGSFIKTLDSRVNSPGDESFPLIFIP